MTNLTGRTVRRWEAGTEDIPGYVGLVLDLALRRVTTGEPVAYHPSLDRATVASPLKKPLSASYGAGPRERPAGKS
jgi:hypothetical protein